MNKGTAGLIYGSLQQYLDHLAPLCSLLEIPLILADEDLYAQAKAFYPKLDLIFLSNPFEIVKSFNNIIYTVPRIVFDKAFFIAEAVFKKKIRTFWLPHGNSDKGHHIRLFEGLKNEKHLFVYGNKMVDFLEEKNICSPFTTIGNYRLEYFKRHRSFYNNLIQSLPLPSGKKIVLYAPTWQDDENSSSFFEVAQQLFDQIPSDIFLIVKLHPNLEKNIRALQLQLCNPHVYFLNKFTPIYPLLEKVDIYLGDMSSIGYDFLTFNRPMFFFNPHSRSLTDKGLFLHQAGRSVLPSEYPEIFTIIKNASDQSHLTEVRKRLYVYTFGENQPWKEIQHEIFLCLEHKS